MYYFLFDRQACLIHSCASTIDKQSVQVPTVFLPILS